MLTEKNSASQDRDTTVESPEHTLVTFGIPVESFALSETIAALPDVEFDCESGIQCGASPTMPLLWVQGADRAELEAALNDDSSVQHASLVDRCDGEFLYRMEWANCGRVRILATMLTSRDAIIRDLYGSREGWAARVLFTSRDGVSKAKDRCETHNVDVSIIAIREMQVNREDRYGLTDMQRKSLSVAYEKGYFEVPRATGLDEVADSLGLTHQSLSERIRRGHNALIKNTIVERNQR